MSPPDLTVDHGDLAIVFSSRRSRTFLAALIFTAAGTTACGDSGTPEALPVPEGVETSAIATVSASLKGSGASFPDAFYQEAVAGMAPVAPKLRVTYEAVGSAAGREAFARGLADFAGTDSEVRDGEDLSPDEFLYIPATASSIAVIFHLPGIEDLRLDGPTLARIFQRDVTTWDDEDIAALNPDIDLPSLRITVARRADGAGTTKNFTRYLDSAAPGVWRLGVGDTVEWPASTEGGQQNPGVAHIVSDTPGGIGYLDFGNAKEMGLAMAAIANRNGEFIVPSVEAATAALAGATLGDDLLYDPLDGPGAGAYPITAPTYLLVRTTYEDRSTGEGVVAFVRWLITEGADTFAPYLGYAPLPDSFRTAAFSALDTIRIR